MLFVWDEELTQTSSGVCMNSVSNCIHTHIQLWQSTVHCADTTNQFSSCMSTRHTFMLQQTHWQMHNTSAKEHSDASTRERVKLRWFTHTHIHTQWHYRDSLINTAGQKEQTSFLFEEKKRHCWQITSGNVLYFHCCVNFNICNDLLVWQPYRLAKLIKAEPLASPTDPFHPLYA